MTNNGIYLNDIPFDIFMDYYNENTIENLEPSMIQSKDQFIQYNFTLNNYILNNDIEISALALYDNIDLDSYLISNIINENKSIYYKFEELFVDDDNKSWFLLECNNSEITNLKELNDNDINLLNANIIKYLNTINNCDKKVYKKDSTIIIELLSENYYYQETINGNLVYIDKDGNKHINQNNNFDRHQEVTRKIVYKLNDDFYKLYIKEKNTIYSVNQKEFLFKDSENNIKNIILNNGKLLSINNNIITAYIDTDSINEFYISEPINTSDILKLDCYKRYIETSNKKISIPINNKIDIKIQSSIETVLVKSVNILFDTNNIYLNIKDVKIKAYNNDPLAIFYTNETEDILLGISKILSGKSIKNKNKLFDIVLNNKLKIIKYNLNINFSISDLIKFEPVDKYYAKVKEKMVTENEINKILKNIYIIDKMVSIADSELQEKYTFPFKCSSIIDLDYEIGIIKNDNLNKKRKDSLKDDLINILENGEIDLNRDKLQQKNYLLFYNYSMGLNNFMRNNILENKIVIKDISLNDSISNSFIIENKNSISKSNDNLTNNNNNIESDDRYILTRLAQYEDYPLSKDYIKYISSKPTIEYRENLKTINNINLPVENKISIPEFDTATIYKEKLISYLLSYYYHGNNITPEKFYTDKIKKIFEDYEKTFLNISIKDTTTNELHFVHDGSDLQEIITKLKSGTWRIYDS